jgi:hypothetical protein
VCHLKSFSTNIVVIGLLLKGMDLKLTPILLTKNVYIKNIIHIRLVVA